jgi:excisionase family DNA binding protein
MTKVRPQSVLEALAERHRRQMALSTPPAGRQPRAFEFIENRISFSVTEFAAHTGLSPKSVERMIKRGEIQAKRVGRRVLIPTKAIEAWLHQSE